MTIRQEITIAAKPEHVYAALTDATRFSAWTGGAPAEIAREAGGAFACFGGMITGRQVDMVPGRLLVQAWRAGNWPAGVYSIVRFELSAQGTGTKVTFEQSGHPAEQAPHLEAGWHKMYWEPLKAHLA